MKDKILAQITFLNITIILSLLIIIFSFTMPLINVIYDGYAVSIFKLHNLSFNLTILDGLEAYKFDGNFFFIFLAVIPFIMGLFSFLVKDDKDPTPEYINIGGSLICMFSYMYSLSWMRKNESLAINLFSKYQVNFGYGVMVIFILFSIIIILNFFSLERKR